MKTFNKFNEDIEQRRAELAHRQREKADKFINKNKKKEQAHRVQQQAQRDADTERENLKREIKNELRRGE